MAARRKRLSPLFLVCLLAACGTNEKHVYPEVSDLGTDAAGDASSDVGAIVERPPERCTSGTFLQNGVAGFADRSTAAGFSEINALGVRLSVVDIDGDAYPDLAVRRSGDAANSFDPEGTRRVWLLRNKGDATFEDVTRESGLLKSRYAIDDVEGRPSEILIWGDVDNDGDLDAFSGFTNDGTRAEGAELMLNDGNGTFSLYGPQLAFHRKQEAVRLGGASFVDYDRDGRLDLWLGHGFIDGGTAQDRLYQQVGNGGFQEVTEGVGLTTAEWVNVEDINLARAHTNSWSTLARDLDGDGAPDFLSASYGRAPNHLWLSGSGNYTNASVASGYAYDENQDWWESHAARCYCDANPSAVGCDTCPEPLYQCPSPRGWLHDRDTQPFRLGGNSGTTAAGDVDNDGDLDLLTTEIVHFDVGANSDPSELLINDGAGSFSRPGNAVTGLERVHVSVGWDDGDITGALFDLDNDGRLDVLVNSTDYPDTRAWMWHQQPNGTFDRLEAAEGIDHKSSHGVAIADFDRDGDLDVVLGHSANRCSSGDHCYPAGERHIRYFENLVGQDGNWLQLTLEGGPKTNRAAIGAQVTVEFPDGSKQVQEVDGGHGHYGIQHDLTLHFGLGEACEVDVVVRWPDADATEERFTLQTGYRWAITQGEGASPVVE